MALQAAAAILGGGTSWTAAPPPVVASDPTVSVLPAANDAYTNWSKAGLQSVGGIPNRTVVCDTISHGDAAFTITTTKPNDIIVLFFGGNGFPAATVSGVSSPNTTGWAQRGSSGQLTEWVGKASSVLTKEPLTVTISGSPIYWVGAQVVAISGANFSSPFDGHSGLPVTGNPVSISTSNTGADLILGGYLYGTGTPTAGAGWTGVGIGWNGIFAQYQVTSGAQTSLSITRGFAASTAQSGIGDAFVQASGATIAIDGYETGTPIASGDDSALISNADASCPAGQVVMMNAGTFTVTGTNLVYLSSNVTLRGTGNCTNATGDQTGSGHTPYCQSVIDKTDGWAAYTGGCVASCNSPYAMVEMGPFHELGVINAAWAGCSTSGAIAPGSGSCAAVPLDADAAQGATTIQVDSTTPFTVGMQVKIDEGSGAQWVTDPVGGDQVYASLDFLNSTGGPATGRNSYNKFNPANCCGDYPSLTGYPYNSGVGCDFVDYGLNCDRPTSEIHTITAIGAGPCPGTGCTLTFDSPLTIAMRRSGAVSLTGSISGTTLTTSGDSCTMSGGAMVLNTSLTGTAVLGGTYVTTINSCGGGVGNYTVTRSQTVPSESLMGAAHEAMVYYLTDGSGNPYTMGQYIGLENITVEQGDHGEIQNVFLRLLLGQKC